MVNKNSLQLFFVIMLLSSAMYAQSRSYSILSSDEKGVTIQYTTNISDSNIVIIDNQKYLKLNIIDGYLLNKQPGSPLISYVPVVLGVPSQTGTTIQVISSEYKTYDLPLCPIPFHKRINNMETEEYKLSGDYFSYHSSEDLISFGEYGIQRGIPVQTFRIEPIKFNPQEKKIKVYTNIIFRISYNGSAEKIYIDENDELVQNSVINFDYIKRIAVRNNLKLKKELNNSVLSSGTWYKFEAPTEGIYKITKSMLQQLGIDPNVDPRTIKIYNNGGKVLAESNSASVPNDLIENAIYIAGEDDGVFNDDDYILFYGRGINFLEYKDKKLARSTNPYSLENYYFITSGGADGKRIKNKQTSTAIPGVMQSTTLWMIFREDEKINLINSGRIFLGDNFGQNIKSRKYDLVLNNLASNDLTINYEFIYYTPIVTSLDVYFNNILISSNHTQIITDDYIRGLSIEKSIKQSLNISNNQTNIEFRFGAMDGSSVGYLNYYEIIYNKFLKYDDNNLIFFSKDTSAVIKYEINNANKNLKIFDVTDFSNVTQIENMSENNGVVNFTSAEYAEKSSKYVAVKEDNFYSIKNISKIENQNIHNGIKDVKYIIISPNVFKEQADKFKTFRENSEKNKLSCGVFDVDEIYNEFSGGLKDPTGIRNFIKYAYDNWNVKPEYVLLFGDGTYDYRNIGNYNNNYIPTYESTSENINADLDEESSYATDDYFVCVDGRDWYMDLSIGRFPINSTTDADIIIDKIKNYENNSDFSAWRNIIALSADDIYGTGGNHSEAFHTQACEDIVLPGVFDVRKIYMQNYPMEITGGGIRRPQVTKALLKTMNDGCIMFHYSGHANPEVWTHEYVLEKNSFIPQLSNKNLFFLTVAGCEFGYFDNPNDQSGAELFLLKKDGGAVGVIAADRLVYSQENNALFENYFSKQLLNTNYEQAYSVGKALYLAKIINSSINDEKFILFGDPSLKLNLPKYEAVIDSVNGTQISNSIVTLKALGKVKVNGTIKRNNVLAEDLNCEGILTCYDSDKLEYLKDTYLSINAPGGIIYKGRTTVKNGHFILEFTVPKDISNEENFGKILFYYSNNETDGIGYTKNIKVKGIDTTNKNDNNGPEMNIAFDNENDIGRHLINPNSKLIVTLKDETGLNTTGNGIGHKLEGILNNDENNVLDFSNYFTGDLDAGGKSGKVVYPFNDMAKGRYELKVKAWDVYNNYSTESAYFEVVSDLEPVITDVYNYPNPFKENTVFTFQHSINKPVDIKINIYSVAGRLIRKIEKDFVSTGYITIPWDGKDQDGNNIANGVYLYKVIVNAVDGSVNKTALGKLAVIK